MTRVSTLRHLQLHNYENYNFCLCTETTTVTANVTIIDNTPHSIHSSTVPMKSIISVECHNLLYNYYFLAEGELVFDQPFYQVGEGDGPLTFCINATGPLSVDTTVSVFTQTTSPPSASRKCHVVYMYRDECHYHSTSIVPVFF